MNHYMRLTILRLGVAILTFAAGLTVSRLFSTQPRIETILQAYPLSSPQMDLKGREVVISDCRRTDSRIDPNLASEIVLETTGGMVMGSSQNIVFLRRGSTRFGDASVTARYTGSMEQWRGKLAARHYNTLLSIIEAQEYSCLNNEYTMGWMDSPIITISVTIGDHRKVVKATSEAVPNQLRSICEAIDRTRSKVRWSRTPVKVEPNKRIEQTLP